MLNKLLNILCLVRFVCHVFSLSLFCYVFRLDYDLETRGAVQDYFPGCLLWGCLMQVHPGKGMQFFVIYTAWYKITIWRAWHRSWTRVPWPELKAVWRGEQ